MVIQIQIQDDTWEFLNQLKKPGETFDDVIKKQLMMNPEFDPTETYKKGMIAVNKLRSED